MAAHLSTKASVHLLRCLSNPSQCAVGARLSIEATSLSSKRLNEGCVQICDACLAVFLENLVECMPRRHDGT